MSQSQYQRLESNESDLRWSKIEQICEVLDVTTGQLLGFDEKYVIQNCTSSGFGHNFTINNLPDQLIAQYEAQIKLLKDEVAFLRGLVK
jgi:transcriptional regulator with XRE-family HTH domain